MHINKFIYIYEFRPVYKYIVESQLMPTYDHFHNITVDFFVNDDVSASVLSNSS